MFFTTETPIPAGACLFYVAPRLKTCRKLLLRPWLAVNGRQNCHNRDQGWRGNKITSPLWIGNFEGIANEQIRASFFFRMQYQVPTPQLGVRILSHAFCELCAKDAPSSSQGLFPTYHYEKILGQNKISLANFFSLEVKKKCPFLAAFCDFA